MYFKAEISIGENELHELQNNLGRNPAVQNANTPASSSIDRRNSRNIGQAISYSETQKCKLDLPERKEQDKGKTLRFDISHFLKKKLQMFLRLVT